MLFLITVNVVNSFAWSIGWFIYLFLKLTVAVLGATRSDAERLMDRTPGPLLWKHTEPWGFLNIASRGLCHYSGETGPVLELRSNRLMGSSRKLSLLCALARKSPLRNPVVAWSDVKTLPVGGKSELVLTPHHFASSSSVLITVFLGVRKRKCRGERLNSFSLSVHPQGQTKSDLIRPASLSHQFSLGPPS